MPVSQNPAIKAIQNNGYMVRAKVLHNRILRSFPFFEPFFEAFA